MDSTAKPVPAGAEDLVLARGDTKPNGDYERVVREELARVQERLTQLAPIGTAAAAPPEVKVAPDSVDAHSPSADKLDANITAFRAADVTGIEDRSVASSTKRGLARVLVGLLLAGTIVGGGAAWAAYGEAVKSMIANGEPEIGRMWSQVSERFGLSGSQGTAPTQTASAETPAASAPAETPAASAPSTAPPQAAPPQATAPQPAAAAPAAPDSADVGQMLQSMAHDIASLQQGIDQLRAGQEQMARDNAKLTEQLRASQEQLAHVMARASEQALHPRPTLPPRPVVAAVRRPLPPPPVATLPPPQAIAPPVQAQAEPPQPGGLRPPRPVPEQ